VHRWEVSVEHDDVVDVDCDVRQRPRAIEGEVDRHPLPA
jgi:hypothetical protein